MKGKTMIISYKKLWHLLIEREMSNSELRKQAHICPNTFTRLIQNREVSLLVLQKICYALKCDIGDIMEFVFEEGEQEQ